MTKYPLSWPAGWKRTRAKNCGRFSKKVYQPSSTPGHTGYYRTTAVTVAEGTRRVLESLARMGIRSDDTIISTNLELRMDGLPRSNQKEPSDAGAAVYWRKRTDAQHKVMAIDQYTTIGDNLAAIAATLEAMRAIERHGGAVILERAFTGFAALQAPNTWRAVMGYGPEAGPTLDQVRGLYRRLVKERHPDVGGSESSMKELNWAMQEAERELA